MAIGAQSAAVSGHNTKLYMQAFPIVDMATDAFVLFAEATSIGDWKIGRNTEEVTPHAADVASFIAGEIARMETIDFEGNYIFNSGYQDKDTGVLGHITGTTPFRVQLRGPSYVADTDDYIDFAAIMVNVSISSPTDAGARKISFTVQPTGTYEIDGEEFGTGVPS